jgi:hypothetical protein
MPRLCASFERSEGLAGLEGMKKKTIIEMAILALLIIAFALGARMVGEETSLLPWSW